MDKIFLQILNMSITAGYVILVVMITRLLLKKAPKIYSYVLWSVVLFRLICPISFESMFSLVSINTKMIPQNIVYQQTPKVQSGIAAIDEAINHSLPNPVVGGSANPMQTCIALVSAIWLLGIFILLTYSLITTLRLHHNLKMAHCTSGNIYEMDGIKTPFVFGLYKPKIYLPEMLAETEKAYIIKHEQTHIKRFDYIIKPFAFLVLCVHWFNPLVWIAFFLMGADMELSCDESVIKQMGSAIKKDYSSSLLTLSTGRRIVGGCPLTFGENNTKGRIKNVLGYKKPTFWVIIIAVLTVIVVFVGLLSNPGIAKKPHWIADMYGYRTEYVGDNSKVSNICNRLPVPETFQSKGIELKTKEAPYIIELKYNVDNEDLTAVTNNQTGFQYNAILVFSLVENVEMVKLIVNDKQIENCTREWAEEVMGVDLWEESQTLQGFQKQVDFIMKKIAESKNTGIVELPISFEEALAIVKKTYPKPYFIESKDDSNMVAGEVGYTFMVYPSTKQEGRTEKETTLAAIIGIVKSTGELWGYGMDTDKWTPVLNTSLSKNEADLEQSISNAIISNNIDSHHWYEVAGEGHITLETEEKDGLTYAYILERYVRFGFENEILTDIGGHANPATLIFAKNHEGRYILKKFVCPEDGDAYLQSIQEMFSQSAFAKFEKSENEKNKAIMDEQAETYAKVYLKSISRNAAVSITLRKKLINMSTKVSNYLLEAYGEYPYWDGTLETVEDGVRFVYQNSWEDKKDGNGIVTFSKRVYQGKLVEKTVIEVSGDNIKCLTGTLREVGYSKWN